MQFDRSRSLLWTLAVSGLLSVVSAGVSPAWASPDPDETHAYGHHPSASVPQQPVVAEAADTADTANENSDDADSEEEKWSVDNAPGPTREIPIQVDEGTWMSLDVSPDGRTIVFDLLGDLYEMPIQGGRAKPITAGVSWDMQPRYSPDGTKIAFTSDRDGGDNLWVMKRMTREQAVAAELASSSASADRDDEAEVGVSA